MSPDQVMELLRMVIPAATMMVAMICGTVLFTTRMKIKNGYPLSGAWGQAVYPKRTSEDGERIALLTEENAALIDELGTVKGRLANIERIVTDSGYSLNHEIEQLRSSKAKGREKVQ